MTGVEHNESERIGPGVVLMAGNVALSTESIGEIIPLSTFPNNVILEFRISNASCFPVKTKLLKDLCFSVTHLSSFGM